VFPGGGRLLFADRHGLKWLYPDGTTVRFARGFHGAQVAGGRLITWDKAGAYVMNLDGSRRRLVLPFRPGKRNGVIGVCRAVTGRIAARLRRGDGSGRDR